MHQSALSRFITLYEITWTIYLEKNTFSQSLKTECKYLKNKSQCSFIQMHIVAKRNIFQIGLPSTAENPKNPRTEPVGLRRHA